MRFTHVYFFEIGKRLHLCSYDSFQAAWVKLRVSSGDRKRSGEDQINNRRKNLKRHDVSRHKTIY